MNLLVFLAVMAAASVQLSLSKRPKRRQGVHRRESCMSGDGSSYRGTLAESASGRLCLNWRGFRGQWGSSRGVGDHRYCRNPDQSLKPWCHVKKGRRFIREFCDVPRCAVTSPPAMDTEYTCGEKSEGRTHRIVGGSFIDVEAQPWVTAIFHRKKFLCGGSLISPCWVLTAAHCFTDGSATNIRHLSVFTGKNPTNESNVSKEQTFQVEKLIIHPSYEDFNNDIALIQIRSIAGGCARRTASARTVCLPPPLTRLPAGFQCRVAGYGQQSYYGANSRYLKEARVNLMPQADCLRSAEYINLFTNNMFCAASPDWKSDACKGDSGGPLVCEASGRAFLFGIVSWGVDCGKENQPGVYTQVTNYNKWIADNTQRPEYTKGVMYPRK
ncbi:plasminogen activator, urokinase a [Synchiropus picturatus]